MYSLFMTLSLVTGKISTHSLIDRVPADGQDRRLNIDNDIVFRRSVRRRSGDLLGSTGLVLQDALYLSKRHIVL